MVGPICLVLMLDAVVSYFLAESSTVYYRSMVFFSTLILHRYTALNIIITQNVVPLWKFQVTFKVCSLM